MQNIQKSLSISCLPQSMQTVGNEKAAKKREDEFMRKLQKAIDKKDNSSLK